MPRSSVPFAVLISLVVAACASTTAPKTSVPMTGAFGEGRIDVTNRASTVHYRYTLAEMNGRAAVCGSYTIVGRLGEDVARELLGRVRFTIDKRFVSDSFAHFGPVDSIADLATRPAVCALSDLPWSPALTNGVWNANLRAGRTIEL